MNVSFRKSNEKNHACTGQGKQTNLSGLLLEFSSEFKGGFLSLYLTFYLSQNKDRKPLKMYIHSLQNYFLLEILSQ